MCKSVILGSSSKFKIHRRRCNKERDKPIECEICHRMCDTLTGYTVHKLFHEASKNERVGSKEPKEKPKETKEEWICEQCGKVFKSVSGYQCHILTIHTKSDRIWQCEVCSKICANKLALKDHKRNSHKVQESPCNVCFKVFRTKVLLRKHMMYHDETKRTFKCQFCPDKPGYFTNVALKRHQRSHNGERYGILINYTSFFFLIPDLALSKWRDIIK
jgi:KRAB domain-containing zinc finger protein